MVALADKMLVTLIVLASLAYAGKALLPFRWRVALARHLAGKVPDALRIWLAGVTACERCGSGPLRRFKS